MKYDPRLPQHRTALAGTVLLTLKNAGFTEETDKHNRCEERVFSRAIPNSDVRILVYTSIDCRSQEMRTCGIDAVRVCGVREFRNGKTLGVIKRKRVNRVGDHTAINDRMLDRMRSSWAEAARAALNPTFCSKCGAREFITKKGNKCCSELCWKK